VALYENRTRHVLVGRVGNVFLVLILDGWNERAIELRTEGLVVIRPVVGVQEQAARDIDTVRIAVAILVDIVREAGLVVGADLFTHIIARLLVVDGADDRHPMGVIASD